MTPQQLKNSILQMAVQGKLAPQNEAYEPASVLLERIRAEKERLIKEGKIKKEKPLPPITDDEKPFAIPDNWEWVRFSDLMCEMSTGPFGSMLHKSDYAPDGIPLVNPANIVNGKIVASDKMMVSTENAERLESYALYTGMIVMGRRGEMGRCAVVTEHENGWICGTGSFFMMPSTHLFVFYITMFVSTPYAKTYLCGESVGTTMSNLNHKILSRMPVPLPPLDEQQRIVEKIEELEPFFAAYEKAYNSLEKLNSEFPDKLKKSILQEAVQGKLVPQNENDEPASILLERIKQEKERLIKEGKIKKEKPLPPITDDEKPFDIPDTWEWVRLGTILTKLTDGTHSTPKYAESGVPFLSVKDMSSGFLCFDSVKRITEDEHKILYKRCDPKRGDILLTKVGTTGIPVYVDTDIEFSLFVSVAQLRFSHEYINAHFLIRMIQSPLVQQQCAENTKGVGNKNWVMRDIANTLIVLPPLAEQRRIVEYLDGLLPKLNEMKIG